MIADNLDSQDATRNPPYISALDKNQTDDHKVPAGKTDQVTLSLTVTLTLTLTLTLTFTLTFTLTHTLTLTFTFTLTLTPGT